VRPAGIEPATNRL